MLQERRDARPLKENQTLKSTHKKGRLQDSPRQIKGKTTREKEKDERPLKRSEGRKTAQENQSAQDKD